MNVFVIDDEFSASNSWLEVDGGSLRQAFTDRDYDVGFGTEWPLTSTVGTERNAVLCWTPDSQLSSEALIGQLVDVLRFGDESPDVILLDVNFDPHTELGLDFLREIRNRNRRVSIVMMSTLSQVASLDKSVKLGFGAGAEGATAFYSKGDIKDMGFDAFVGYLESVAPQKDVQRELSNAICRQSDGYDLMECEHLGTLSFFLQEDYDILQLVSRLAKNRDQFRVLDLGCGTGRFEELLAPRIDNVEMVGIDMSPGMLSVAQQRLIDRGIEGVRLDLGFAEEYTDMGRFDFVILGFGFLSYCDAKQVLENIRKNLLADEGRVFASFYQRQAAYYTVWNAELEELLTAAEKSARGVADDGSIKRMEAIRASLPIATVIDRDSGTLLVPLPTGGLKVFPALPMTGNVVEDLARSCGFGVDPELARLRRTPTATADYLPVISSVPHRQLEKILCSGGSQGERDVVPESGDLEELLPRYLEYHRRATDNPDVRINCDMIAADWRSARGFPGQGYYGSILLHAVPTRWTATVTEA